MKALHFILFIFLLTNLKCQGQPTEDIKFLSNEEKTFFDKTIQYAAQIKGTIRVFFKDSVSLVPIKTEVVFLKFSTPKHSTDKSVNFSYSYSKKYKLNKKQNKLKNEYLRKIDSIFINGNYEFQFKKNWVLGNKLDFTFTYEILPAVYN
ncbi:hypothetical protein [Flavobacterium johnsoniae]|uniref:Uncharacterized protein n=1 Tax=Flavobacterium johnsoniae TaxID=986 RepID=A0A1J7C944_FLAJO|nr:hypothetical protein [Flavobacterium johnsoniae]OIV42217.1 hypothetical protein BKM63_11350 [Flavobacterium johnsoniae]